MINFTKEMYMNYNEVRDVCQFIIENVSKGKARNKNGSVNWAKVKQMVKNEYTGEKSKDIVQESIDILLEATKEA